MQQRPDVESLFVVFLLGVSYLVFCPPVNAVCMNKKYFVLSNPCRNSVSLQAPLIVHHGN